MPFTSAIAIAASAVVVAALGATYYATQIAPGHDCPGTAIAGGAIGGPFELISETGDVVTDADVITEPTLIYFGYTFCPDVCPIDNARNAAAVDILAEKDHSVTPVFITVDPARDTVQVVSDYTENFHPKMIGLTGSPEQTHAAAAAYRVVYDIRDEEDPEYYLVDHSVFTYLALPEIGFVDFFRRDDSPQQMADRVACALDAAA